MIARTAALTALLVSPAQAQSQAQSWVCDVDVPGGTMEIIYAANHDWLSVMDAELNRGLPYVCSTSNVNPVACFPKGDDPAYGTAIKLLWLGDDGQPETMALYAPSPDRDRVFVIPNMRVICN
jgi:hypothetical protein